MFSSLAVQDNRAGYGEGNLSQNSNPVEMQASQKRYENGCRRFPSAPTEDNLYGVPSTKPVCLALSLPDSDSFKQSTWG